jgi:hypothetical protein
MRKLLLSILCLCLVSPAAFAEDEKLSVDDILLRMEKAGDYTTSRGDAVMKIIDADGEETEMKLIMSEKRGEGDEDDKSLMRFTSPARLKGTAILTVGDSIWYYNNRTNRIKLLSQSAKKGSMMGSSFTYEDLELDYAKDFTGEILSESRKYYELKLFPKEDRKYKFLLVKVRKEDFITERADYYNDSDLKYKELLSKEIREVDGRKVPLVVEMDDIEDRKVTVFEIDEESIEYDIELDDKIFSEENLKL